MIRVLKLTQLILSVVLLAACSIVTPEPAIEVVATGAQSLAPVSPIQTVTQTLTRLPSLTPVSPTPTAPQAVSSTSTPALPISSPPDGLRMAYVKEGGLYLQDGNHPPVQLTYSKEDWRPTFSKDGEKIVLFRGLIPHDLYSVNADGRQEQALVTSSLLTTLGSGYDEWTEIRSLAFVPGTHRLLFNTHQLNPRDVELKDSSRLGAKKNNDLLIVDTDTGEIERLLSPGQGGGFKVSPDGRLVAVLTSGHVDVISIDGRVIRRNLVTYIPSQPVELTPHIYWMPDSNGLIVLLPAETEYDMEGPPTYTVWHYPLEGSAAVQVPLDPPPMGGDESVSPDGNWIIYQYFPEGTASRQVPLYVGDLRQGRAQLYAPGAGNPVWSPDSTHFVYEFSQLFLGAVDSPPALIDEGGFQGWVDASRYLYISYANGMIMMGEIGGETVPVFGPYSDPRGFEGPPTFNFIYVD